MNAILYIGSSGCQGRLLPKKDFPPVSTVRPCFYPWRDDGTLEAMTPMLVMCVREMEGREASPTAGIIDSQSVKTTESGGVRGYDAGKTVKGRNRPIGTDTLGLMLFVLGHAATIQDRDGACDLIGHSRHRFPWRRHIFADSAYAGPTLRDAIKALGAWTIESVRRPDQATGFGLLPRRWVVERTFAWLGRCRRPAKGWERTIERSTAWTLVASIRLMTRRLARHCSV